MRSSSKLPQLTLEMQLGRLTQLSLSLRLPRCGEWPDQQRLRHHPSQAHNIATDTPVTGLSFLL